MISQQQTVAAFLKSQQLAVLSTTDSSAPESALIAFVEDEELCLYFQTGAATRKVQNLRINPRVSLVMGLTSNEKVTLQYQGQAEEIIVAQEIIRCKQRFYDKNSPTTRNYLERPDAIFFKIEPRWLRYSDYTDSSRAKVFEMTNFN